MQNFIHRLSSLVLWVSAFSQSFLFQVESFVPSKDNLQFRYRKGTIIEPLSRIVSIKAKQQQLGEFETLNLVETDCGHNNDFSSQRNVRLYDLSKSKPIHYETMWEVQKELVDDHVQRLKVEFQKQIPEPQFLSSKIFSSNDDFLDNTIHVDPNGDYCLPKQIQKGRDAIILLQHKPVYTLGTGSDPGFIKNNEVSSDNGRPNIDVVRTERGGEVTYHGPGQLVAYPILDLRGYKQDIHWYMRALEEAILIALKSAGVTGATREDDVTGVWVDNKKIAALGVKVRRWVTMHGLSVNVERESIQNFDGIVPCGLEGRDVCCINDFLDEPITVEDFSRHLTDALQIIFEIKLVS